MGKAKKKAGSPPSGHPPPPAVATPLPAEKTGGQSRTFYIVLGIFLATRLYILLFAKIMISTVAVVNVNYALYWQIAQRQAEGFYKPGFFGQATGFYGIEAALRASSDPGRTDLEYLVEYPPLAISWMVLPVSFLPPIPEHPQLSEAESEILANRVAMFLVDVGGFFLLLWVLPIAVPRSRGDPHYDWRLLVYCAGGVFLTHLLYDRLDLPVGVLVLAALGLLCRRVHYLASFAVLAVAINFKITPVMLVPVWIVGALPASLLAGRWDLSRLCHIAGKAGLRLILLLAITIAIFLPYYWQDGVHTLDFLKFHSASGLEIESTWATLDMLASRIFGYATQTVENFGSDHLFSPLTPLLSRLWSPVTLLLFALAGVSLLRNAQARLPGKDTAGTAELTAAQAAPDLFTSYTVLFLLVGICGSKAFSPQYLLWLVPLIPLLAPEGKTARWLMAGFLVICLLTTAIYPYLFMQEVHRAAEFQGKRVILPPTDLGVGLLVLRNLLVLGFTAALWKWRWRHNGIHDLQT